MARQHIPPGVSVKGFQKCCISNAMDETTDDDDVEWQWRGGNDCEDEQSDTMSKDR
jgi:hypothetical protein